MRSCRKLPFFDHLVEILVGGSNNSDVHIAWLEVSDALNFSVLQNPEELHLKIRGHFANFVEKQGSPVGGLKFSNFLRDGPSKRSFSVTKELGLEEVLRDSATVDRNKGALGAVGEAVQLGPPFLFRFPSRRESTW